MKYTFEYLQPYVESSRSFSEMARQLNLSPNGGSSAYLSKVVKKLGLNTKHFYTSAWRSSVEKKGHIPRKTADDILVFSPSKDVKTKTFLLVRALIEIGRKYVCEICNIKPEWNSLPLTLQVDHCNGNVFDNRRENLRFICPNCHSQTATYGYKNAKFYKNAQSFKYRSYDIGTNAVCFCLDCGKGVKSRNVCCLSCAAKRREKNKTANGFVRKTKIQWPEKAVLQKMVDESSYVAVGRLLGVSDNAVRKRLMAKNHQE